MEIVVAAPPETRPNFFQGNRKRAPHYESGLTFSANRPARRVNNRRWPIWHYRFQRLLTPIRRTAVLNNGRVAAIMFSSMRDVAT